MMTDLLSHNGKAYFLKRIYMYVSVTESLCCIAVINTTLYINCTSIKKKHTISPAIPQSANISMVPLRLCHLSPEFPLSGQELLLMTIRTTLIEKPTAIWTHKVAGRPWQKMRCTSCGRWPWTSVLVRKTGLTVFMMVRRVLLHLPPAQKVKLFLSMKTP